MISPVGSTISKDITRSRVCPKREPSSEKPLHAIRPPTKEHGYDAGVSGKKTPYCLSSSLSFSMLMPGPTVTVRSARSISWIWFIRLTSTMIPPRSGTAPSLRPVPPARGTTGILARLASLTISDTCCAVRGSTTTAGMCSAHLCTGKGAGTRARLARLETPVSTDPGSFMIASSSATTASSTVITGAVVIGQPPGLTPRGGRRSRCRRTRQPAR